jgi:hypothetical protein
VADTHVHMKRDRDRDQQHQFPRSTSEHPKPYHQLPPHTMTLQGTVVDRKRQFLQSQKQILKRGIPLSNDLANIANEGGIPSRVLTDALRKVNRDLSRHARLVHSRQMTEHVVEQIDIMYWEAGTTDIEADTDITSDIGLEDKSTLYQSDDLTLDS